MNWNGVHISLLLLVEVFYMSASADANGNNFKFVKGNLMTLMKNAKGIQRNYKVSFMYLFFYKQKVHIQLGQGEMRVVEDFAARNRGCPRMTTT